MLIHSNMIGELPSDLIKKYAKENEERQLKRLNDGILISCNVIDEKLKEQTQKNNFKIVFPVLSQNVSEEELEYVLDSIVIHYERLGWKATFPKKNWWSVLPQLGCLYKDYCFTLSYES